jgi:hypothetical protein
MLTRVRAESGSVWAGGLGEIPSASESKLATQEVATGSSPYGQCLKVSMKMAPWTERLMVEYVEHPPAFSRFCGA